MRVVGVFEVGRDLRWMFVKAGGGVVVGKSR